MSFEIEKYIPHKTPYKVIDALKECIEGKSFYEIGTGWGYILNYVKNNFNCPKLGGLDYRKETVEYCAKQLGVPIDLNKVQNVKELSGFDVYYMWCGFGDIKEYEEVIKKISDGLILISFHLYSPRCFSNACKGCGERVNLTHITKTLQTKYNAKLIDTYYYENEEPSIHKCRTSGLFRTVVIKK